MRETQRGMPEILSPADFESFTALRGREQYAVWVALDGIARKRVGKTASPMIAKSSRHEPFDFQGFQKAMSDLGIRVENTNKVEGEERVYVFDPIPFEDIGK